MSILRTLIINKHGSDLMMVSPVPGFQMNIAEGGAIEHITDDAYNIFARFESITFLPGKETLTNMESTNVVTRRLAPGKLKLKVRKNWEEPKRTYPTCWFLNESESPLTILSIDAFDWSKKVRLMQHLPVLSSVPIYSSFAPYKQYTIKESILMRKSGPGYAPGAGHMIPQYVLEDPRKGDDLAKMKRLLAKWKDEQKSQVKVIM